jgi:cell division protein FtsW
MARARHKHSGSSDYVLLTCFVMLLLFGLVMLTSASSVVAFDRFGDAYFFVKRQLLFGVLPGLVALLVFSKISLSRLRRLGMLFFYAALALLVVVLIPGVGSTLGTGARSWFSVGGFSFQPAEFMKLGLILFLASSIATLGKKILDLKQGFLPTLGFGLVPVLLVAMQPDIGSATILFAIVFGMLFIGHARFSHLGLVFAVACVVLLILVAIAPYRAARITAFFHPEIDPQGTGYHTSQSLLAVGSGGWLGAGLGGSQQKFEHLPEVHADSIFAIIAEEMGFLVTSGLIVLLVFIGLRGFRLAAGAKNQYARLIVSGIIIWFLAQSFFNIAAMVRLMPITGVPLPFISHGGTALLIALSAVGVLIRVSKESSSV